ncbi:MAG: fluoride efflux transporter CrcB [Planctomycetota bacterium]|nr:MAG: fluoride efflux transporter CrcB [Planctomycetota bacterium]
MTFLAVMIGGAVGALSRYVISKLVQDWFSSSLFPWGTLTVNLLGCLLLGFCFMIGERYLIPPHWRNFVFVGIFGALTTFSTYSFETLALLQDGEYGYAMANILANNGLGILCVFLGFITAKWWIGR